MTAQREFFGLRVDLGQQGQRGQWIRYPSADYWCRCGYTASAAGDAVAPFTAVAAFNSTVQAEHLRECSMTTEEPS